MSFISSNGIVGRISRRWRQPQLMSWNRTTSGHQWRGRGRAVRAQLAILVGSRAQRGYGGHVEKRALRTTLLARLRTQKEEDRRRKSETVGRKLARLAVFRRAKRGCCYVALPYEVQTWPLIQQMLEAGKRVVVPAIRRDHLVLAEIRDPLRDLAPGAFGVWEPKSVARRLVKPEQLDLVLVPGLAFDRLGNRLGHGQGYFDRLLCRLPDRTATIGLCFEFQLLDYLPPHPHDRPVQQVLAV